MNGQRVDLGTKQDQGITGVGSLDCTAKTLLVRASRPLSLDVPLTQL